MRHNNLTIPIWAEAATGFFGPMRALRDMAEEKRAKKKKKPKKPRPLSKRQMEKRLKKQEKLPNMRVFAEYKPEDVLPYAGPGAPPRYYKDRDGKNQLVKMTSLRYQTFQKSLKCVVCGIQGTVMRLEVPYFSQCPPHFNLYAVVDDRWGPQYVLMTKDHIVPKSKGGPEHISNMQTMCTNCNQAKGCSLPESHQQGQQDASCSPPPPTGQPQASGS